MTSSKPKVLLLGEFEQYFSRLSISFRKLVLPSPPKNLFPNSFPQTLMPKEADPANSKARARKKPTILYPPLQLLSIPSRPIVLIFSENAATRP